MKTIEDIRQENILALIQQAGSIAKLGRLIDRSDAQINQWAKASIDQASGRKRTISSDICRYIEETIRLERGWMDNPPALQIPADVLEIATTLAMLPPQVAANTIEIATTIATLPPRVAADTMEMATMIAALPTVERAMVRRQLERTTSGAGTGRTQQESNVKEALSNAIEARQITAQEVKRNLPPDDKKRHRKTA